MAKKQMLVFLFIGIIAGLLVTACAGAVNGTLTISGTTSAGTGVKFQQVQAPLLTINMAENDALYEAELFAVRATEKMVEAKTGIEMAAPLTHHCDGGN